MKIRNIQNILVVPMMACLTGITTILFSVVAVAQGPNPELSDFQDTLDSILSIVGTTTAIVVGLAFLFFFFNLGKYILKGGEAKEEARKGMIWGLIAIIVLTSLWGIIVFVRNLVGISNNPDESNINKVVIPKVPKPTNQGVTTRRADPTGPSNPVSVLGSAGGG